MIILNVKYQILQIIKINFQMKNEILNLKIKNNLSMFPLQITL